MDILTIQFCARGESSIVNNVPYICKFYVHELLRKSIPTESRHSAPNIIRVKHSAARTSKRLTVNQSISA